jgi:hypothetical protein
VRGLWFILECFHCNGIRLNGGIIHEYRAERDLDGSDYYLVEYYIGIFFLRLRKTLEACQDGKYPK